MSKNNEDHFGITLDEYLDLMKYSLRCCEQNINLLQGNISCLQSLIDEMKKANWVDTSQEGKDDENQS